MGILFVLKLQVGDLDFIPELYCEKGGISFEGDSLKQTTFTTVQACKEECANTKGCTAFTTVAGTVNECRLKNKDHGAESADPNSISARMSCYEDHHCWKKGISLPGGVIKNILFTTVEACKEECAKTEGCVAFATNAGAANECRLKNKDHGAESAGPNSISARMSCYEDHYCLKKGISLPGGVIKNILFTTVEACKEECAKTEGCVAFATNAGAANKCRLKNKDHGAESADPNSISARMSCYEDHYCLKKGFGLKTGGAIKNIPFTTVQACKEECAKTEGCVAFTTAAGTVNKCRLKNKDHGAEYAGGFHITAFMSCYAGNN